MLKFAIITGSTRPMRINQKVAEWVYTVAKMRSDAIFELVDIADYNLPMFDEPLPPTLGEYQREHTKIWSQKIANFDGFVFVTPEYNHSITGVLKNAIDFLYSEWNNKSAGFVSYGAIGGLRAIEHLRLILSEAQIIMVYDRKIFFPKSQRVRLTDKSHFFPVIGLFIASFCLKRVYPAISRVQH